MEIGLIYAALISIAHLMSDYISLRLKVYREKLLSFGAGVSIAYLFLHLLPMIHDSVQYLRELSYVSILVGFSFFHLVEKFIYQHSESEKRINQLKEVHGIGFFLYHFIVGIVLYYITTQDIVAGTLLFIPVLFHSTISSASTKEIHAEIKENFFWRLLVSSSSVLGALLFMVFNVPPTILFSLLGAVVGGLFYIIIKDILPEEKEGDPKYFILGVILFVILIFSI